MRERRYRRSASTATHPNILNFTSLALVGEEEFVYNCKDFYFNKQRIQQQQQQRQHFQEQHQKCSRSISLAIRPFGFSQALDIPSDFHVRFQNNVFSSPKAAVSRKPSNALQKRPRRCSEVS